MEVTAILLARVLAFFETGELQTHGNLFFPDLVKSLVQRCSFQKFPVTLDNWRSDQGAVFEVGKWGNTVVDKLIIYSNGLQVETAVSTSESKRIIEELLVWSRDEFGSRYDPSIRIDWGYVSSFVIRSDVPLLYTSPLEKLSRRITAEISGILGQETPYHPTGFSIGHDPLMRKHGRASFTLQRRADVPFSENKYFTESPLPTEIHMSLLEQYEKDVAEMLNLPSPAGQSVRRLG